MKPCEYSSMFFNSLRDMPVPLLGFLEVSKSIRSVF